MEEIILEYNSVQALYKSYLPFTKDGGLYVKTSRKYDIGVQLTLSVMLPSNVEPVVVSGVVCWITPAASHSNLPQGVGVAFSAENNGLKERIETILGPMMNSYEPTFTM
ncbi:PilZ domain-containing protein [Gayadomonas joobiniege]|uniref:PilZ domain-containing protein n=1 Tax=Gayadomonas joobiniege TaxID=1234606 RepID=UPI000362C82F|nr:PilZ domain-containing protein [Gayadomonas joobiniege]